MRKAHKTRLGPSRSSTRLIQLTLAHGLMALLQPAWAGNQLYEPLADSVRVGLHSAVSDSSTPMLAFASPQDARAWLAAMSDKLALQILDRAERARFLTTVHYEAKRAGLDPQMVLGLIQVESAFRQYAVSSVGARGYMQVMPFWVKSIGNPEHNLFNLRLNLRYGCTILRHYLDIEHGDLYRALGRYNGSLGQPQYPTLVVGAWRKHWDYANIQTAKSS